MTSVSLNMCQHCGEIYHYQMSGSGDYTSNNRDLCPTCFTATKKALEAIPKKFDLRFVDCNDFSREKAIELATDYQESVKLKQTFLGFDFRRVFPGLYDPITKTHSHGFI